jgi:predicted Zn-dependent peptidase
MLRSKYKFLYRIDETQNVLQLAKKLHEEIKRLKTEITLKGTESKLTTKKKQNKSEVFFQKSVLALIQYFSSLQLLFPKPILFGRNSLSQELAFCSWP